MIRVACTCKQDFLRQKKDMSSNMTKSLFFVFDPFFPPHSSRWTAQVSCSSKKF